MIASEPDCKNAVKLSEIDINTRNAFVTKNIGLAFYFASKYRNRGIPFQNLLSAGYLGLLNAAMNYDPARGSFGACAWVYIKHNIFNEFRYDRLIQIPSQRSEDSMTVRKTREKLEQRLKRDPLTEEIAETTGLPVQDVTIVLENEAFPVSIFQGCNESGTPLIDILHYDIPDEPELQSFELQERLKKLTSKERFIIYSYLWKEETLEEIGRKLGTNRESIRLIILKAFKKLKKNGSFILKTDRV